MIKIPIYRNNSASILLPEVKNPETGEHISDATVTATFLTPDGVAVDGYSNITMLPIVDKAGWYGAILEQVDLPVGSYMLRFTGVHGEDGFETEYVVEVKNRKK